MQEREYGLPRKAVPSSREIKKYVHLIEKAARLNLKAGDLIRALHEYSYALDTASSYVKARYKAKNRPESIHQFHADVSNLVNSDADYRRVSRSFKKVQKIDPAES